MENNKTFRNKSYEWTRALPELYNNHVHADVTLVCEGKSVLVHRSILASLSPLFSQLLVGCESCVEPVILLEGFRYSALMLLVNFLYKGIAEGSSDEIIILTKYAKELQVNGIVSSGQSKKPLKLELLERKIKVKEQLKNLQSNESDSESSSFEDDELQIVFEKNVTETSKPIAMGIHNESLKCAPGRKRPISPSTGTPAPILQKKKAPQDLGTLASGAVGSTESSNPKPTSSKVIKCSICKEIFESKPTLKIHLGTYHSDVLTCSICDKLFSARSTLKKHLKNHISKLDGLISSSSTAHCSSEAIQMHPQNSTH